MKKQILLRTLNGIPIGIAIGYLITLCISYGWGNGEYTACMPTLVEQCGSELSAMLLQTCVCAVLGAVFGGASVIWELERWSLIRQTASYFVIAYGILMPSAWIAHWMERSVEGFMGYTAIFLLIFIFMWLVQLIMWKWRIKRLNKTIHQ